MEGTLAMGATVSLPPSITGLVRKLRAQRRDLGILDLEGHPVTRLPLPQVNIDPSHHLDAVPVLAPKDSNLHGVVFQLRRTKIPSLRVLYSC